MDPRLKIVLEKAVDMEPNEKLTAALDSLYVKMTVVPLQRAFRERNQYGHLSCGCCYRRYSSSDDDE